MVTQKKIMRYKANMMFKNPILIQTEEPDSNEENDPAPNSKKPSNRIQLPQIKSHL